MNNSSNKKLKGYLKSAAKAWAKATLNIEKFAECYALAVANFGEEARDAFRTAYPMFGKREWNRMWLIGNYILLPQFMFKSDSFVSKLLKLKDHMKWQHALVSASEDGKLIVDRGHGPEKVHLSDLTKKEEKTLAMLMSDNDAKLTPKQLLAKFGSMVRQINKNIKKHPQYEYVDDEPRGKFVRFYGKCDVGTVELRNILNHIGEGERIGVRTAAEILKDMSDAVVEYSSLRDDEWDFEEKHGNRDMWNDRTCRNHEKLLNRIQASRDNLTRLVREATGDGNISV